jgi:hypothetical protein
MIVDMFRTNKHSIRTVFDLSGVTENELEIAPLKNNSSNLGLLNSTEFENKLLLFILTSKATEKAHYEPLMKNIDAILKLIEQEIKQ